MFGILASAARSAQQRSLSYLWHIRSFHYTVKTPQSTSTRELPLETPIDQNPIEPDQVTVKNKRGRPRKFAFPPPPKAKAEPWQNHASPKKKAAWRAKLVESQQRRRSAESALPLSAKSKPEPWQTSASPEKLAAWKAKLAESRNNQRRRSVEFDQVSIKNTRGHPRKSTSPLPQKAKAAESWRIYASEERVAAWKARLAESQQKRRLRELDISSKHRKKDPGGLSFEPRRKRAADVPGDDGTTTYHIKRLNNPDFTTRNARSDYFSYLLWARGMGQGRSSGDNKRINIVSPSLCDDVLERLKPSLEKHIGCDIIDVNPGAGIWSEKLHNFLKPRTHLLLEPDQTTFGPLLRPLVDAPESKYEMVEKSGIVWGHLETILSEKYLPHQKSLEPNDPGLEQPNDTLLLVANLGYHPKRSFKGFPSIGSLVIYQLLSALRSRSLVHRYGAIRMMIWIENEEIGKLLPQSIATRRPLAIEAEISCERVQAIAASSKPTYNSQGFGRSHELNMSSARLAHQRMQESGISTPNNRQSSPLLEVLAETPGKPRDHREDFASREFLDELDHLEALLAEGKMTEDAQAVEAARRELLAARQRARDEGTPVPQQTKPRHPQQKRLQLLRYRYATLRKNYEDRKRFWLGVDEIDSLQRKATEVNETERSALDTKIRELTAAWNEEVDQLPGEEHTAVISGADNIRALQTKPPLLLWDRRDFEPLEVGASEFLPAWPMCLIDFQPKAIWPVLRQNFPDNYDVLELMISHLMMVPTQSLRRGLSALTPGAYEYLIGECPSLRDPMKGGSINPDDMTVRRLTTEMYKEMIEAWVKWPFKPTRYEVMSKMGSEPFSDADGTDIEGKGL